MPQFSHTFVQQSLDASYCPSKHSSQSIPDFLDSYVSRSSFKSYIITDLGIALLSDVLLYKTSLSFSSDIKVYLSCVIRMIEGRPSVSSYFVGLLAVRITITRISSKHSYLFLEGFYDSIIESQSFTLADSHIFKHVCDLYHNNEGFGSIRWKSHSTVQK